MSSSSSSPSNNNDNKGGKRGRKCGRVRKAIGEFVWVLVGRTLHPARLAVPRIQTNNNNNRSRSDDSEECKGKHQKQQQQQQQQQQKNSVVEVQWAATGLFKWVPLESVQFQKEFGRGQRPHIPIISDGENNNEMVTSKKRPSSISIGSSRKRRRSNRRNNDDSITENNDDDDDDEDDDDDSHELIRGCDCGIDHSSSSSSNDNSATNNTSSKIINEELLFCIQCDSCQFWYEVATECIGLDREEAKKLQSWMCRVCLSSSSSSSIQTRRKKTTSDGDDHNNHIAKKQKQFTEEMTPSSSSDATSSSMVPATTTTKSSTKVLKWENDESKAKRWKLNNPCTGSGGIILKPPGHKKGKCKNCICCQICIAPPWCQTPSAHKRKKPDIVTTTMTTANYSSILQRTLMAKQTSYPTPPEEDNHHHHHHLVKSSTIPPKLSPPPLSEIKTKPIGPQTTSKKCTTHGTNMNLPPRVAVAAAATTTTESGRGDRQGINIPPMTAQSSTIITQQKERHHHHHHQQQQRIENKVAGIGKHQRIDSIQLPPTRKTSKESVSLPKHIEPSNVLYCRETGKKGNNTDNTKSAVVVVHRAMNGKCVGRYRSMEATARAIVKYHPDVKAFVDSYPHKLDMDTFRRGIRRSLTCGNTYMGCHFKYEVQQQQQQHKAEASNNNSTAIVHKLMMGGDSAAASTASFKRYQKNRK